MVLRHINREINSIHRVAAEKRQFNHAAITPRSGAPGAFEGCRMDGGGGGGGTVTETGRPWIAASLAPMLSW
ncbi:unnamed protein product, partial [Iphiclides podalirius]